MLTRKPPAPKDFMDFDIRREFQTRHNEGDPWDGVKLLSKANRKRYNAAMKDYAFTKFLVNAPRGVFGPC